MNTERGYANLIIVAATFAFVYCSGCSGLDLSYLIVCLRHAALMSRLAKVDMSTLSDRQSPYQGRIRDERGTHMSPALAHAARLSIVLQEEFCKQKLWV